jgi:protocatechuate 3,4-dioxygenase beta subunit
MCARRYTGGMRSRIALAIVVTSLALMPLVPPVAAAPCPPTAADMLGPFYVAGAPERSKTGDGVAVEGFVRSTRECKALSGAKLEWWSANPRGDYDDGHRATQVTDGEGRFHYVTDMPGKYPGRPVHLHVKVTAPGHKALVTQVYPKPHQAAIAQDFVLQAL